MKIKYLFPLVFFLIIGSIKTDDEIKKDQTLNFHFENKDDNYFAYLNYEEDYHGPGIEHQVFDINFLKIDFRINVLYNIKSKNESNEEYNNEMQIMNVNEKIKIGRYNKLKNGETLFLKFTLKDEYKDSFDKSQIFSVEMVNSSLIYLGKSDFNEFHSFETNFKPKEVKIFKIPNFDIESINEIDFEEDHYEFCCYNLKNIFVNSPISAIFSDDKKLYYNLYSNLLLYGILFDYRYDKEEDCLPLLDLIVYNEKDVNSNINIEYKINENNNDLYPFNLTSRNSHFESIGRPFRYANIISDKPGIFNIKQDGETISSYFDGDIESIKNVKDLLDIKHYKYLPQGIFYSSKNYFILYIDSFTGSSFLNVSKIDIKEKGSKVNDLNFYYFSISKGNTLNFTSKFPQNPYILKLFSNEKGTVDINNKTYNFENGKVEIIQLKEDEILSITAIDGNFTFGIKCKIMEQFIDIAKVGENYTLSNNTNYKFIVYDINYYDYSSFYFKINYKNNKNEMFYRYDFGLMDINEIQMKEDISKANLFYFYLSPYSKMNLNNKKFHFVIFFGNISENSSNITIETKYLKKLPSEKGKYFKIEGQYFNYVNKQYKDYNESYFAFPCKILYELDYSSMNSYASSPKPFIMPVNNYNPIFKSLYDTDDSYAFVNNLGSSGIEKNYSYFDYIEKNIEIAKINSTHFRFRFFNFFSNEADINYILVVSNIENYNLFEPDCSFLENFYLNNNFKNNETIEFYNFSLKDMTIIYKDMNKDNYIDLPIPSKFNISNANQNFIFKAIGITSELKYIKIYNSFNFSICYWNCETCSRESEGNNNYCLTCNKSSEYKYLLNYTNSPNNCVNKCPFNTILDEKMYQCIDKKESNKSYNYKYLLYIGIPFIIFFIALIIFVIIRMKRKNKIDKDKDKEITDIKTQELIPN